MNTKQTDNCKNTIPFKRKRMPKGWKFIGDNSLVSPEKTYTERFQEMKAWNRLMVEAEKYNAKLSGELAQRRHKKIEDNVTSQAEALVEKKYKKDKTQVKIPKTQAI